MDGRKQQGCVRRNGHCTFQILVVLEVTPQQACPCQVELSSLANLSPWSGVSYSLMTLWAHILKIRRCSGSDSSYVSISWGHICPHFFLIQTPENSSELRAMQMCPILTEEMLRTHRSAPLSEYLGNADPS